MTEAASSKKVSMPAVRSVPLVGDEPAMRDWAAELVARARAEGVELTGENGLLTGLVRQVLQTGLEVEMTDHLGYERHAAEGRGSGNSRNGATAKTVTTEIGKVALRVPRDRDASFEPQTVRKGQRRLDGLTGNVISFYAKGMTTGDIQAIWPRSTTPTSPATRSPGSPTPSSRAWWAGRTGRSTRSTR